MLVALGLGSCIGVALLDGSRPSPALAHVVLPESRDGDRDGGAGEVRRHRGARAARRDACALGAVAARPVRGARRRRADVRAAAAARWTSAAATSRPCARRSTRRDPGAAAVTGGSVGRTHPRPPRHRPGHLQGGRRHRESTLSAITSASWRRQHERATSSPTTRSRRWSRPRSRARPRPRSRTAPQAARAARARHRLLAARASSRSDQQRRLERAHEAFCRTASTQLSAELLTRVEMEVLGVDQLTWSTRDQPDAAAVDLRDRRVQRRWAPRS